MLQDTLRRTLLTAMAAYAVWWLLRRVGQPTAVAMIGPLAVLYLSHRLAGAWTLGRVAAREIRPNTTDEPELRLYDVCLRTAMDEGVALPRVYVSDTQRRLVVASGPSRRNPGLCVRTQLFHAEGPTVLDAALRKELYAVRFRTPLLGTVTAALTAVNAAGVPNL